MTVVCCWFDQSYARKRITAIADSRASREENKKWVPLQESTLKIIKVRVACHHAGSLDTSTGRWPSPYAETELGLCFAGYCFEALSIAALFQKCVEQLVLDGGATVLPDPWRLADLLREISARYFRTHSNPANQKVSFLLFGFSQKDGQPWVAKVTHTPDEGAKLAQWEYPTRPESIFTAGDVGVDIAARVQDVRNRIARHADGLDPRKFADRFAYDLEGARHHLGDKKQVESVALKEMDNILRDTVGGVLQKAELFRLEDNRAALAFCRDDRIDLLDGLPDVAPNLGFIPVVERMGDTPQAVPEDAK
ncbi:MAG: hypothetical protein DI603_17635 [Roseateles depolymerans]|uniref:Uncharacterized protein n=1 Tax=Roseateles depolymerans TaxID=76731 RepID=A0A2W5DEB7_9BURK|nr:MAG: hypothetical protein DI603_17635 [Roseateles depolymerans]